VAGDIRKEMSTNPKTVEGIYRDGKVELQDAPDEVEGARVIVTFLAEGAINLAARGIDEDQAVNLRKRLSTFAEDWELPEMGAYDAL
jgi:hypothetical protein